MAKIEINDSLYNWNDLKDKHEWSGLLVGNGASRAVWDSFGYGSLYDIARGDTIGHPLGGGDEALFDSMGTKNFEQVLAALAIARVVNSALRLDTALIDTRYNAIQTALVEAVHKTHIPWLRVSAAVLSAIKAEMLNYSYVYSTNYDLLLYWAVMHETGGGGFVDYFWGPKFDIANCEVSRKVTRMLYLHGGLHLYRSPSGATIKRSKEYGRNLLELFGTPMDEPATPLFIAEGNSNNKLSSIYRSDYLAFAFNKLVNHPGPLVIFGHGLGESDQHIVDAIKKSGVNQIAISVMPGKSGEEIIELKGGHLKMFPHAELLQFDATTHPLGNAGMRIPE